MKWEEEREGRGRYMRREKEGYGKGGEKWCGVVDEKAKERLY